MAGTFGVSGLISGLSTSQIIDALMAMERAPLTNLQNKKTQIQTRSTALDQVQSKLSTLRSAIYQLTLQSSVNAKQAVTNTPSTSPTVLTATATSEAANGSFQVTVNQLATATAVRSGSAIGEAINATAALDSAGFAVTPTDGYFTINTAGSKATTGVAGLAGSTSLLTGSGSHTVTIGSQAFTFTGSVDTVQDVLDSINSYTSTTGVRATFAVSGGLGKFTFSTVATGSTASVTVSSSSGDFAGADGTGTGASAQITVDASVDTLNSVVTSINTNPSLSGIVTASLTSSNYLQLSSSTALGLGSGDDTSNFLAAAKLLAAAGTAPSVTGSTVTAGALASTSISINGVVVTTRATAAGNTAAQNAVSLAYDINSTAGIGVTAMANADGTLTLGAKTGGVGSYIDIGAPGAGTGLSAGVTTQSAEVYTSTSGLGVTNIGVALASSRLATPISGLVGGVGEFKVNGVSIDYSSTDTISGIISRINSSSAGVTAAYDSVQDKLQLAATATGSQAIALQDVTGNFLAATGVLSAAQTLGQKALFSVSTVNGGAQLSSSSNTISGVVPGVTLEVKSTSSSPVTVTVGQNTATTIQKVRDFVTAYNDAINLIRDQTAYNASTNTQGILGYDSTIKGIESNLKLIMSGSALGVTGAYQSLSSLGLTTGSFGSAVGSTSQLVLDETKLTDALTKNPDAVSQVFTAFSNTATLAGGGTGSIASISGVPTLNHQAGSYVITSTASGGLTAVFTPTGGQPQDAVTGSISASGTNTTLIPGITITANGVLTDGTNTITVTVEKKGTAIAIDDYVKNLTSSSGLFASRETQAEDEIRRLDDRISQTQQRLDDRQASLEAQFSRLEKLMSQLQYQSNYVGAQIAAWAKTTS
ncbi:MAG: flagellar filament capping protein FliD [Chloroflexi bacterium]|nr:flagellar filament capping protein FliD [Chloroflexota bacterium]